MLRSTDSLQQSNQYSNHEIDFVDALLNKWLGLYLTRWWSLCRELVLQIELTTLAWKSWADIWHWLWFPNRPSLKRPCWVYRGEMISAFDWQMQLGDAYHFLQGIPEKGFTYKVGQGDGIDAPCHRFKGSFQGCLRLHHFPRKLSSRNKLPEDCWSIIQGAGW